MAKSKKRIEMGEEAWAEYQRNRKNQKALNWKSKNIESVVNWRRRTKLKLIEYKGGRCQQCGYDKEVPGAYAFHHRDPKKKSFAISALSLKWETLKKEADKCDLLCQNCHAETHDNEYAERRKKAIEKHKEWAKNRKKITAKKCIQCKCSFLPQNNSVKHCSTECSSLALRKCKRPSKQQLEKLIAEKSWCAIGRKFRVSDNAVRKWAKAYNLM